MTQEQNWRIGTNGEDYFRGQQKRNQMADRRPVIRRPSDLVGPGIAKYATRLTDYEDSLGTYNGFYSSEPAANGAPNSTDSFVGITVTDSLLGGWQQFKSLDTGYTYERTFLRATFDPEFLSFGPWSSDEPVPMPFWTSDLTTEAASAAAGWRSNTVTPTVSHTTDPDEDYFTPVAGGIQFNQPGVYSVEATCVFDTGADGFRYGFSFYTENGSGAVYPSVTVSSEPLGGTISTEGGAFSNWRYGSANVRVTTGGARVKGQVYVASTVSRLAKIHNLTAVRLGNA